MGISLENKQAVGSHSPPNTHQITHPSNGSNVSKVNAHKHIVLNLGPKLLFVSHLNEKINKAKKLIGNFKYLSYYIPHSPCGQMYKIFTRPQFDYYGVIYLNPQLHLDANGES